MLAGQRLGSYVLVEELGAGGMGVVWRATDTRLGRDVALKILPPHLASHPEGLARFEREARGLASLSHPNIVSIHDVGHEKGLHFLVTELLEGQTLRDHLKGGPMPWPKTAAMLTTLANALSAAHAKGIIHRDLKPENIFLTIDGRVKVLDFGLAKDTHFAGPDASTHAQHTEPGRVLGTLGYMSPEQLRGEPLAPNSDLFALGCVLFEALSGRKAFVRATSAETIAAILTQDAPALDPARGVPRELRAILARCLDKRPAARFQSTEELAAALRDLPAATTLEMPAVGAASRGPWLAWGAAVLLLGGAVGLVMALRKPGAVPAPAASASPTAAVTLALLPFVTDDANAYASEGFVDGLRRGLAGIAGLRVILPKHPEFEGRAAARLLRGSIKGAGPGTTVDVELVEGADGRALWKQRYTAAGNLHELEGRISRDLGGLPTLAPGGAHRLAVPAPTYKPEAAAYREFLKGRHHWNKFTPEGRQKALHHYQQAIDLDPAYAMAYCGLADTWVMMGFYGEWPEESFPKARAAARRAIEVDPGMGEAHTSLGTVLYIHDWKWQEAEASLRKGVELSPSYPTAHLSYGVYLGLVGRLDESLRELETALELDPLSVITRIDVAWVHYLRGQIPLAMETLHAALRQDPRSPLVYQDMAWHLEYAGRCGESIAATQKYRDLAGKDPAPWNALAETYRKDGEVAFLRARLEHERRSGEGPITLARTMMRLGDREGALKQLEVALQRRDRDLIYLKCSPIWQGLRGDPRFEAILGRIGFP